MGASDNANTRIRLIVVDNNLYFRRNKIKCKHLSPSPPSCVLFMRYEMICLQYRVNYIEQ